MVSFDSWERSKTANAPYSKQQYKGTRLKHYGYDGDIDFSIVLPLAPLVALNWSWSLMFRLNKILSTSIDS